MAYPTLVLHLLVSAPGDVPEEDLGSLRKAIAQWNLNMGRHVGLTIVPVSWTEHAAAEFGERPQAILNEQIVSESDLAVALFYDRLGTPTGEAESGTAEEIQVLVDAGKQVAVFVSSRPRPPLHGEALDERSRLTRYLSELRQKAIVLDYANEGTLIGHLNNFLSRATAQFQQSVQDSKNSTRLKTDPSEGVWPRAEVHETAQSDPGGRIRTHQRWFLVLHNTSRGPASDVDFVFEGGSENALFKVAREDGPVGIIPPDQEVRFPLLLSWGSPRAAECLVTWTDASGNARETRATVRT